MTSSPSKFALISPNLSEFTGRLSVFCVVVTSVVSITGTFFYSE